MSKHICLLRISALGDVTHVLPLISAIRHHWQDCRITWIVGKLEQRLVGSLPGVEFIIFDKKRGFAAYSDLFSQLREQHFDVLLHLQLSLRANLVAAMVKAPTKIGFDRQRAKEGHSLMINTRIPYKSNQHVMDALLSYLPLLGINRQYINYDLPIADSVREQANQLLTTDQPYIVISPASSHALRNWNAKGYAKVADHIIQKYAIPVVLSGGRTKLEYELGQAIESAMSEKPLNIIGKDTIEQLVAILDQALLLISPDSGPVHIANAVATPVLGLYAATDPQRSGPYHSRDYCIDRYADAAEKFLGKSVEELNWGRKIEVPGVMDLITAEEVIERVDKLVTQLASD